MSRYTIRQATEKDLRSVAKLEIKSEKKEAACGEEIARRFFMFPEGFFVAEQDQHIVGYLDSCIWRGIQELQLYSFGQIGNFARFHDLEAQAYYVIFLAVDPDERHQGIGTSLVQRAVQEAVTRNRKSIELVAKNELVSPFYRKMGFNACRPMSDWLPRTKHTLMRKVITTDIYR